MSLLLFIWMVGYLLSILYIGSTYTEKEMHDLTFSDFIIHILLPSLSWPIVYPSIFIILFFKKVFN